MIFNAHWQEISCLSASGTDEPHRNAMGLDFTRDWINRGRAMKRSLLQTLVLGIVLIFLVPGWGRAQSGNGSASASAENSASDESSTSAGKAHDASYTIGNDD